MSAKFKFLCIVICLMLGLSACSGTTYTESILDYLVTDVPLSYPEHVLFPQREAISDKNIVVYQSESKSTFMYDDVYFLLTCTYSDNVYEDEVARFETCGAEYNENLFNLPAYVMLFSGDNYEYALLDDQNNMITYVSAQTADWGFLKSFPEQYLPTVEERANICCYPNVTKGVVPSPEPK